MNLTGFYNTQLEEMSSINFNQIKLLNNAGEMLHRNQKLFEALKTYGESLSLNRNQPEILHKFGIILFELSGKNFLSKEIRIQCFNTSQIAINEFLNLDMKPFNGYVDYLNS